VTIINGWSKTPNVDSNYELSLDDQEGSLIGTGRMERPKENQESGIATINITKVDDENFHDLYIIFTSEDASTSIQAGMVNIQFN